MKAFLKNYRQHPRKVRLVAGLVKGKNVDEALTSLDFLVKRAGLPIRKLLISAIANAKQLGLEKENLFIKELRVDKGIVMKRTMPRAMGRGAKINKRTSHVTLVLAEKVVSSNLKKSKKNTQPIESTPKIKKEKKSIIKKLKKLAPST